MARQLRKKVTDLLKGDDGKDKDAIREAMDEAAEDADIPEQVAVPHQVSGEADRVATVAGALEQGVMDADAAKANIDSYFDPEFFTPEYEGSEDFEIPRDQRRNEAMARAAGETTSWTQPGDPWTYTEYIDAAGNVYFVTENKARGVSAEVRPGDPAFDAIAATKPGADAGPGSPPLGSDPASGDGLAVEPSPHDDIEFKGTAADVVDASAEGPEVLPTFDAGTTVIRSDMARVPGQDALERQQRVEAATPQAGKAARAAQKGLQAARAVNVPGAALGAAAGGALRDAALDTPPGSAVDAGMENARAVNAPGAALGAAAGKALRGEEPPTEGETIIAEFERAHGRKPANMAELKAYLRTGELQGESAV